MAAQRLCVPRCAANAVTMAHFLKAHRSIQRPVLLRARDTALPFDGLIIDIFGGMGFDAMMCGVGQHHICRRAARVPCNSAWTELLRRLGGLAQGFLRLAQALGLNGRAAFGLSPTATVCYQSPPGPGRGRGSAHDPDERAAGRDIHWRQIQPLAEEL